MGRKQVQYAPGARGDDVIVFGVYDERSGALKFVGASRRAAFPYRTALIKRGASSHYTPSQLDMWVRAERANGRRVAVLGRIVRSAQELGMSPGQDGRHYRRLVDNLVMNHIASLPSNVQAGLLNKRTSYKLQSHLMVGGTIRRNDEVKKSKAVVYGMYHNGRLIYVGTTKGEKHAVIHNMLQGRYNKFTKSRVLAYVGGLEREGRLNELTLKKLAAYEGDARSEVFGGVLRSLGKETVRGLLNDRAFGYMRDWDNPN